MNQTSDPSSEKRRTWLDKFRSAWRGVWLGVRGPRAFESTVAGGAQRSLASNSPNSFWVHAPVAVAVVVAGLFLNVGSTSIALLVLSIGLVVVAELLNTSIEFLASAITSEYDARVEAALDVASGAVLAACLIAVVVGGVVLGRGLIDVLG